MELERLTQVAERLVDADQARRRAETTVLLTLAELAEHYHLDTDDITEVLAERHTIVRGTIDEIGISQYLALEVAGLLGISPTAAASRLLDATALTRRHPSLMTALAQDRIEPHRALAAANACLALAPQLADRVTAVWLIRQHQLSHTGAMKLLDKQIIAADPELAAQRETEQAQARGVNLWGHRHGTINLTAILSVLDGKYLMATIGRLVEIIGTQHPGATIAQLRSRALGYLAHPAIALALLTHAQHQPALFPVDDKHQNATIADLLERPELDPGLPEDPAGPAPRFEQLHQVTTPVFPPEATPKLGIAVHIHANLLGNLQPTARIEAAGHITTRLLTQLLGDGIAGTGTRITVQPVIDPPAMEASDHYVAAPRMRRAIQNAYPIEPFPYSNRAGTGLDLDHTTPYQPGIPGQTRYGNLAPLSRTIHRAKTARHWNLTHTTSPNGAWTINWTSPLGYRYRVTRHGTTPLGRADPPG